MSHDTIAALDTLAFPDRLALWAVRKWVSGHKGAPVALAMLASAFERTGAPEAPARLDTLMRAVTAGAARRIAVHAPCCAAVGADERLLLDALALAQADPKVDGTLLLRRFLTPDGARAAAGPLHDLARGLLRGGLRLTPSAPASAAFSRSGRRLDVEGDADTPLVAAERHGAVVEVRGEQEHPAVGRLVLTHVDAR
jgi:hypothetical protein